MRYLLLAGAAALGLAAQSLKVEIAPKGDVKADVDVPFQVTVKDASGKAVAGADVTVVATMVDMDHGEFKFAGKQVKPGVYAVSPKFVMGGAWNLAAKAKKGSAEGAVSRKIDVKD
jgi:nitrogen fixation protein FixH